MNKRNLKRKMKLNKLMATLGALALSTNAFGQQTHYLTNSGPGVVYPPARFIPEGAVCLQNELQIGNTCSLLTAQEITFRGKLLLALNQRANLDPTQAPLSSLEKAEHVLNRLGYGEQNGGIFLAQNLAATDNIGLTDFILWQFRLAASRSSTTESVISELYPEAYPVPHTTQANRVINSTKHGEMMDYHFNSSATPDQEARALVYLGQKTHAVKARRIIEGAIGVNQLGAVLEEFWTNHFNQLGAGGVEDKGYYTDIIRSGMYSSFSSLLEKSAKNSIMMQYLNNAENRYYAGRSPGEQDRINENYGREIMELHTLGVAADQVGFTPRPSDPNGIYYNQASVHKASEILTGWSVASTSTERYRGVFEFYTVHHKAGPKTIILNGEALTFPTGLAGGEEFIRYLAKSSQTAANICKKLLVKFVADEIDITPVGQHRGIHSACVATFMDPSSPGNLMAVYQSIFSHPSFWSRSLSFQKKVKTPFEIMISSLRKSGAQFLLSRLTDIPENTEARIKALIQLNALDSAMSSAGMPLFGMGFPTGYSDSGSSWDNVFSIWGAIRLAHIAPSIQPRVQSNELGGIEYGARARLLSLNPNLTPEQKTTNTLDFLKVIFKWNTPIPTEVATLAIANPDRITSSETKYAYTLQSTYLSSPEFRIK